MPQVISTPAQTGVPIVPPAVPAGPRSKASLFSTIGQDASVGLVVFLVALPLCLGISLALGAPLLAGMRRAQRTAAPAPARARFLPQQSQHRDHLGAAARQQPLHPRRYPL